MCSYTLNLCETPKVEKKMELRHCFDLFSQNHQLRTITNLGHHTLEKRKFQNFQKMMAVQFFTFVSVHRIVLDDKKSFWPMLGLFRPQILSPKFRKMTILNTGLVWWM
jgi:predicted aldo/keto reductase-like oxidoreductase